MLQAAMLPIFDVQCVHRPNFSRRHVSGIVSSLLSCRYVDYATEYSVDVASQSCHSTPHMPAGVDIQTVLREYSSFTEIIISDRISSMQCANCRKDICAAKQELLSASEV